MVYLGLTYTGVKTVPAGLTAILVSTNPLMTLAPASAWLKAPFGWRGALGLAAGFLGVVWIMWCMSAATPADMAGVALILLGTAALAAAALINRRALGRMKLWGSTLIQLFASGLALLPMAWWSEGLVFVPNAAFFGSLFGFSKRAARGSAHPGKAGAGAAAGAVVRRPREMAWKALISSACVIPAKTEIQNVRRAGYRPFGKAGVSNSVLAPGSCHLEPPARRTRWPTEWSVHRA